MPPRANELGFRRVLIATDFTLAGDRAIRRAALLPLQEGCTLVVAHVLPSRLAKSVSSLVMDVAAQQLENAALKLRRLVGERGIDQVTIQVRLARGDAAAEIGRLAQRTAAELVVVGRGGSRLSGMLIGSTAQRAVRQSRVPVLLVRQHPIGPYRRVVLGIDPSMDALRAARLTVRATSEPQANVYAVHAFADPRAELAPTLSRAVAKARWRTFMPTLAEESKRVRRVIAAAGGGRQWSVSFKGGDPRQRILEVAAVKNADLVAVGTRSRSGLPRLLLGSVAEAVLHRASCDVLVSPRRRWAT